MLQNAAFHQPIVEKLRLDGVAVLPELHIIPVPLATGRVVRGGNFKTKTQLRPDGGERFLPYAEAYYGHAPKSVSAELVTSWPTEGAPFGSQLWHRDTENGPNCLRAMVYLTDVTMQNGPFCFVPGSHQGGRLDPKVCDRFPDWGFEEIIPKEHWETYEGPRGSVILFDTMGYHRGLPNVSSRREALVFTYNVRF